jgi:hypothetical protein
MVMQRNENGSKMQRQRSQDAGPTHPATTAGHLESTKPDPGEKTKAAEGGEGNAISKTTRNKPIL